MQDIERVIVTIASFLYGILITKECSILQEGMCVPQCLFRVWLQNA